MSVHEKEKRGTKNMIHNFDTDIACKVGVNSAILLYHIEFWCEHNRANNIHYHDGYYWTYNSVKAFKELFPYMTEKSIRTALKKLIDEQYILVGEYNKKPYDHTSWYAVKHGEKSVKPLKTLICQKGQNEVPKKANRFAQKGEPIPNNKPNNKTHIYSANRFNQFEQNNYDYDQLEKFLICN